MALLFFLLKNLNRLAGWPNGVLIGLAWMLPLLLFSQKRAVVVIAHRGDHTAAPENTLLAVERAQALGVDYIEVDLRTTRDGFPVNFHDVNLQRLTGLNVPLDSLTLAQLQALRVQDPAHPEWGQHVIPTLEQVLDRCRGRRTGLYLDHKAADPATVYQLVRAAGFQRRIVVYVYRLEDLLTWKKVAPRVPIMMSLPRTVTDATSLQLWLGQTPVDLLDGPAQRYDAAMVQAAKRLGRQVWADIQAPDEHLHWGAALATGLQGLQTDHPQALLAFLGRLIR